MTKLIPICAAFLVAAMPAAAQDAVEGRNIFESWCATCHGLDAKGFGPMAAILTLPPTDLTELTLQNGGEFPTARVVARIDGRDPLVAHGSPMPVFGEYFEGKGVTLRGEDGVMIMTSQPVVDLVAYLQVLQK